MLLDVTSHIQSVQTVSREQTFFKLIYKQGLSKGNSNFREEIDRHIGLVGVSYGCLQFKFDQRGDIIYAELKDQDKSYD